MAGWKELCLILGLLASCLAEPETQSALVEDDECIANATEAERDRCSLTALQRRGMKVLSESEDFCAPLSDPRNDACRKTVTWAAGGGKWDPKARKWFHDMPQVAGVDHRKGTIYDFQRLYFCHPHGAKKCGTPPCTCTSPPCGKCHAEKKPKEVPAQPRIPTAGCAALEDPRNRKCRSTVNWVFKGGKYDPAAKTWFDDMPKVTGRDYRKGTLGDFHRLYFCTGKKHGNKECGTPPCDCSHPPCGTCSLDATPEPMEDTMEVTTTEKPPIQCFDLNDPVNQDCAPTVRWVMSGGGKYDADAPKWFKDMPDIANVTHRHGTLEDFQKLYYCSPPGGNSCGAPPCTCSHPPCWECFHNKFGPKDGMDEENCTDIERCPPESPMEYKGREWPAATIEGTKEMHIFAIGDWGGMDGTLNPIENRSKVVAYKWGAQEGPSVFPRTRWNLMHTEQLCSHHQFVECFNLKGGYPCAPGCGYIPGVDDQPQQLVAKALVERAKVVDPDYLLNVGDNFYWGGIEKTCGTPMKVISYTAHHQFDEIFEQVYADMGDRKWLSVLGNHDWGGRVFNNGWDQQIAYTWASPRWVMPAPYWWHHVDYPDLEFSIDFYFLDSNFVDANDPEEDPEHNICGKKHNPKDANCSVADGPSSIETCPQYFADLWEEQKQWVVDLMPRSNATWQIAVTHFPCGHEQPFYRYLHKYAGLDLLVTGHRHDQELWLPEMYSKNYMGGLTCMVTGGGGGITSEATPNFKNQTDWYGEAQYGFYDLTVNATHIRIQSVNFNGSVLVNATVRPRDVDPDVKIPPIPTTTPKPPREESEESKEGEPKAKHGPHD